MENNIPSRENKPAVLIAQRPWREHPSGALHRDTGYSIRATDEFNLRNLLAG